jgi:hypothetical protein
MMKHKDAKTRSLSRRPGRQEKSPRRQESRKKPEEVSFGPMPFPFSCLPESIFEIPGFLAPA